MDDTTNVRFLGRSIAISGISNRKAPSRYIETAQRSNESSGGLCVANMQYANKKVREASTPHDVIFELIRSLPLSKE